MFCGSHAMTACGWGIWHAQQALACRRHARCIPAACGGRDCRQPTLAPPPKRAAAPAAVAISDAAPAAMTGLPSTSSWIAGRASIAALACAGSKRPTDVTAASPAARPTLDLWALVLHTRATFFALPLAQRMLTRC